MKEIARGLWDWSAFHPNIGARVHSHYWEPGGLLIDPMLPKEGLAWFRGRPRRPRAIILTNRLHSRHSRELAHALGLTVCCHRAGLHEFPKEWGVKGFEHEELLASGARPLEVGALCPEETALALPDGAIALGDSVVRAGRKLSFVPDQYMGDDPEGVKRGLRESLTRVAERPFEHLLLAHGAPFVGDGRDVLRRFLGL